MSACKAQPVAEPTRGRRGAVNIQNGDATGDCSRDVGEEIARETPEASDGASRSGICYTFFI